MNALFLWTHITSSHCDSVRKAYSKLYTESKRWECNQNKSIDKKVTKQIVFSIHHSCLIESILLSNGLIWYDIVMWTMFKIIHPFKLIFGVNFSVCKQIRDCNFSTCAEKVLAVRILHSTKSNKIIVFNKKKGEKKKTLDNHTFSQSDLCSSFNVAVCCETISPFIRNTNFLLPFFYHEISVKKMKHFQYLHTKVDEICERENFI